MIPGGVEGIVLGEGGDVGRRGEKRREGGGII